MVEPMTDEELGRLRGIAASGHLALWPMVCARLAERLLARLEQVEAQRDEARAAVTEALAGLPTEYVDGSWIIPGPDGPEPSAVVGHTSAPSPETGHVGWVWWARGRMGEAPSLKEAKRLAVDALVGADG